MYIGKNQDEFNYLNPSKQDYYNYIMLEERSSEIIPLIYAVTGLSIIGSLLVILITMIVEPLKSNEFKPIAYLCISNIFLCIGFIFGFPYQPELHKMCFI